MPRQVGTMLISVSSSKSVNIYCGLCHVLLGLKVYGAKIRAVNRQESQQSTNVVPGSLHLCEQKHCP